MKGITRLKSIFTPSTATSINRAYAATNTPRPSPSMLQGPTDTLRRVEFPALTGLKKFDTKELPLEEIEKRLNAAGVFLNPDSRTAKIGYLRNDVVTGAEIKSLLGEAAKRHNFSTLDAGKIINPNIAHQVNTGAGARAVARLGFDRYKGSTFRTLSVKGPAYAETLAKYKKEIENLEAGNFQNGFTDELRSLKRQWLKKGDKFLNASGFSTPEQPSEYLYNVAAMRGEHLDTIQSALARGTKGLIVKPTAPGIRHYSDPGKNKLSDFDFSNLLNKTAAYVGNFSKAAVLGGRFRRRQRQ